MAKRIIVEASGVWKIFHEREKQLGGFPMMIAENTEVGIEIWMDAYEGCPNISVSLDCEEIYSELCVGEHDCKITVQQIYNDYLSDGALERIMFGEEDEPSVFDIDEQEMEIECREEALDMAFAELIDIVTDYQVAQTNGWHNIDEIYDDIKEHTLEYIARRWCLPVLRPMFLEDENGETFYEDYPYECMEFEDEDNPLYK